MSDSILDRANRAASGIVPAVSVPGHPAPAHGDATVRLYAKSAGDVLATLARVRDRRIGHLPHPTGALPRGAADVRATLDPHFAARPTLIPRPLGGDPATLPLDHQMTGAILGQFVAENAAGRTGMAKVIVAFVHKQGARHGMDALLLTALLHLQASNDAAAGDALAAWRDTIASAGSVENGDSGVVFDPSRGGLTSVGTPVFRDPFSGGLALPAVVNHMQELQGRDVGIGAFAALVVQAIVGAVKGGIDAAGKDGAGVLDVLWGAAKGALTGAAEWALSALGLDRFIGFASQDKGSPDSADKNPGLVNINTSGDGKTVVINPGAGGKDEDKQTGNLGEDLREGLNKSNSGSTDDNKDSGLQNSEGKPVQDATNTTDTTPNDNDPGKDPAGEDKQVPPPSGVGFPAPDDDGGSPWSLVGSAPLVPMSVARAMIAANAGPVFTVAQLPGLSAVQNAMATHGTVLSQADQLHAVTDPARLSQLRTTAQTIAAEFASHPQIGPALAARFGGGVVAKAPVVGRTL